MALEASSSDQTKIIESEKKMDGHMKIILTASVVLANVVALVALILAIVGVAKQGSNVFNVGTTGAASSTSSVEDKIWMLQIGHFGSNTQYLDEESGTIRGYDVDVVNAVCQLANKNCELLWDLYENCWDHQAGQRARGGPGMMGRWYDGCAGWYNTPDRARTFDFTDPFEKALEPYFFVLKNDTSFEYPKFSGIKVGFLDGWWIDESCLSRYSIDDFDETNASQVFHYQNEQAAVNALKSGEAPRTTEAASDFAKSVHGEVYVIDVMFMANIASLTENADLEVAHQPEADMCTNEGPGLMIQKDQFELRTWWNDAFRRLVDTSQYRDICNNIEEYHGNQEGADKDAICVA